MRKSLSLLIIAVLFFGLPLQAHEFWITPGNLRPEAGAAIRCSLFVGDGLEKGVKFPRDASHIRNFELVEAAGKKKVSGIEGRSPAGVVRTSAPGTAVVTYDGNWRSITLSAEKFEAYLTEEGLTHVMRLRAERGESQKAGRERYRRCAKSLVQVSPASGPSSVVASPDRAAAPSGARGDRLVGLDCEILIESADRSGAHESLNVRLFLHGSPKPGVLVRAFRPGQEGPVCAVATDDEGRAKLPLDSAGFWMLAAVCMDAAPEGSGVDWQSLWASTTLQLDAPEKK